jgi:hypothetical protein
MRDVLFLRPPEQKVSPVYELLKVSAIVILDTSTVLSYVHLQHSWYCTAVTRSYGAHNFCMFISARRVN